MKKLLSILLIIMLIITFIQIQNMYALYKEELLGEYATSLGKWNVKVNGTDIVTPGSVVEFEMQEGNLEYLDNDFKTSGVAMVPNAEVFFDLLFDTSNTDVDVKYIIEFGEINSYNVVDNVTGALKRNENSDDFDSTNDYIFELEYPLKFEIQEVQEIFGSYSISSEEGKEGQIVGEETEEEYKNNVVFDKETSTVTGVIPVGVNKAVIEGEEGADPQIGLQCKTRVKFKWILDESTIAEENKKEYQDMYQYMMSRNNENEHVNLIVPIKVKAIQYWGEYL